MSKILKKINFQAEDLTKDEYLETIIEKFIKIFKKNLSVYDK